MNVPTPLSLIAEVVTFELKTFEFNGTTRVRTERLVIPGATFRKVGLGRERRGLARC